MTETARMLTPFELHMLHLDAVYTSRAIKRLIAERIRLATESGAPNPLPPVSAEDAQ